jgi:hypothetical protein
MFEQENATGVVELFTADGGPGQKKWYSVRVGVTGTGTDGSAALKVNGSQQTGGLSVSVHDTIFNSGSCHMLLVTGDEVTLDLDGATADVVVGMSVDEDGLGNPSMLQRLRDEEDGEDEEAWEPKPLRNQAGALIGPNDEVPGPSK